MVIFFETCFEVPGNVGGYAALVGIGNIVKDGILINPSCGVWGFNAVERTDSRIKGIIAHEIGHFQFGFGTGNFGAHYDAKIQLTITTWELARFQPNDYIRWSSLPTHLKCID
ncbi:MAG: hypothetical protein IPN18_13695 [Ignavibacteriales bacterium]|nr:hypothetical protein [Ignavibacteriales bacterium]